MRTETAPLYFANQKLNDNMEISFVQYFAQIRENYGSMFEEAQLQFEQINNFLKHIDHRTNGEIIPFVSEETA